jgi:hypothetical protein
MVIGVVVSLEATVDLMLGPVVEVEEVSLSCKL